MDAIGTLFGLTFSIAFAGLLIALMWAFVRNLCEGIAELARVRGVGRIVLLASFGFAVTPVILVLAGIA